jgi:hypothetical protein
VGLAHHLRREHWKAVPVAAEKGMPMFTRIGLPQLALIVVILIVFMIYTQRHRF